MFRRRRPDGDEPVEGDDTELADDGEPADGPALAGGGDAPSQDMEGGPELAAGPYSEQAPDDGRARLDLGSLLIPADDGVQVKIQWEPNERIVPWVDLELADGSVLRLAAFAAPRTEGIWEDVRGEIAAGVAEAGGSAEEVAGPSGAELAARVPGPIPGQLVPARFVGIDGPRWFLRAMLLGRAADPATAGSKRLRQLLGHVVVVRGEEAMTVREQIPFRLPAEVAEQLGLNDATPVIRSISPFERGPEITETR